MYDTSDPAQAGWPSVPGSDPGNDSNFTGVALANGGTLVFFTGALPSGQTWQLPSTGFPAANVLAWAGPQGYKEYNHPLQDILLCDPGLPTRQLKLQYVDGNGNIWPGDVNYAALSWLSPDATFVENGMTWIEFTLLGGEVILFGQGVVPNNFAITLPAGFTTAQMFAVAYPHDAPAGSNGNDAHWFGASVTSGAGAGEVTLNYKDGEGHVWHGNAAVLVFAWKNNMGTMVTETTSATSGTLAKWVHCPQPNGSVFGVGCGLGFPNGAVLQVPQDVGDTTVIEASLEAIVGSSGWNYPDNGHPTHGMGACYLDASNVVHIQFEDGEGHVWYGTADVFALFCTPALPPPTQISVSPSSVSVPTNSTVDFTAYVTYNANPDVILAVDGIPGGNATVGTISNTGAYLSPNASGTHIITATSVAAPTVSGSATVTVQAGGAIPNLDQIGDGTLYARPKQTALTNGLVDLSLPGVTDKTAANITYTGGGTVDSMKPAQPLADVTGLNTAANAVALGNVAADSITPIAGLMPSQAGADVTGQNNASGTTGATIYQKAGTYTTSNPFSLSLDVSSLVNDSANGSLWGNVVTFTPGWAVQTPIDFSHGFSAITYDVYVRLRTNGAGNSATYCNFGIYTGYSGGQGPLQVSLSPLTTSYQEVYAGQVTFTQAQLAYGLVTYFSAAGITTQYFVDYVRFTPAVQHVGALTVAAGALVGTVGVAIDQSGNLKLKTINKTPATAPGTLTNVFLDMPGLGSAQLVETTKGNPLLIGITVDFQATSSGGQVTGIGFTPGTATAPAGTSNNPFISISISGDGSFAGASIGGTVTLSGSTLTWTPSAANISGGNGYSSATADVTVDIPAGWSYSGEGSGSYDCTVSAPVAEPNISLSVQVLMDGLVLVAPVQLITDANGRARFHNFDMFEVPAGTHTFAIQAKYDGSTSAVFVDGNFVIVELG
ncbi:MAG: hypothetical protein HIU89_16350 [Proteobacteria bacterium]|nr:hypothetical protein [Pseudomonadota bacterium]